MAFAMHINMERCTGCNNCVVACPVNALELNTVDPASTDKIYAVMDGKAMILDLSRLRCVRRSMPIRSYSTGRTAGWTCCSKSC